MKSRKFIPKAVVLLSGGLDSAVTLYYAGKSGFKPFCLIFDYGQRHIKEISFARRLALKAGCGYKIVKISLPWNGSSLLGKRVSLPKRKNVITGKQKKVIPSTYVPARNIIFLSFALSYAEAIGSEAVFIGAHSQDYSGYPDCRPEFFKAFDRAAKVGTKTGIQGQGIRIIAPLLNKSKAEIIRLGSYLGVPFELTWSCYSGGKYPCGKCDSCYYRAKGFKEARNLRDTLADKAKGVP
ncbi:MAG: 7-cyano-7-deazaguanine synthase QueC [Candidatus Omnitrophota bacterium]|nr:7-cyano-7-deazaguanine synthase QueC [Candidatus Omnitrophota bacterium]MBU1928570.1 7-cyano-7-deazaguanine synthase QueC [Candidatus Omnitrophota bacterium]MBU2034583.1 7-cyano-7-deazaguanine synthase QueC [Candidatus Omnitrophota bacterium]MBU2221537.1 7-cyano-7-deazaguanine synthase QueC [Candidatus Omnitrophota bacterium]MBU2257738.1 7-cyano-7-deazaguanine synthase QueC [Candidatus Omnitrophota bacterium]